MSAPERIWARFTEDFGSIQIGQWADSIRIEPHGNEYIRADLHAADANAHEKEIAVWAENYAALERQLAEREAQVERLLAMQTDREVEHEQQLAEAREVKPGVIERIVWAAMVKAAKNGKPPPGVAFPDYTDTGNSDAEFDARATAARILSALKEPKP